MIDATISRARMREPARLARAPRPAISWHQSSAVGVRVDDAGRRRRRAGNRCCPGACEERPELVLAPPRIGSDAVGDAVAAGEEVRRSVRKADVREPKGPPLPGEI